MSKEALEVLGEGAKNVLLCKWVRPETPAYLSTTRDPWWGEDKKSMILAQEQWPDPYFKQTSEQRVIVDRQWESRHSGLCRTFIDLCLTQSSPLPRVIQQV